MNKYLILEDGTSFTGQAFGAVNALAAGEVVFNTGMTGYQEAITDPSYTNQLLTFTFPLIGTYGTNPTANQSEQATCQSVIVRHLENEQPGETNSLSNFLAGQGIPGISEVDTRALAKHIRQSGTMKAILVNELMPTANFAAQYQAIDAQMHNEADLQEASYSTDDAHYHVAVIDFGIKQAIINQLLDHGCDVTVLPYTSSFATVTALQPDGVLISNGPDDPRDYLEAIPLLQAIETHYPTAGICLGHQLLAIANGASTVALPFGHRGLNHPVELSNGATIMTSQNHGYAVDPDSLAQTELQVTATEENDHTVEGLQHLTLPMISVQYHPEANPGPVDGNNFFNQFNQLMSNEVHVHA